MKRFGMGVALFGAFALSSCAAVEAPQTTPASGPDIVATIQEIVNRDDVSRDDFYSEKSLRARFGAHPTIDAPGSGSGLHANIVGWGDLADGPSPPSTALQSGVYISISKYVARTGSNAGGTECYLTADFKGFSAGMDFESVVSKLGPGWKRDKDAETERFIAITREPFNPPFRQATAPMGNVILVYGEATHRLVLYFNPAGTLYRVERSRGRC